MDGVNGSDLLAGTSGTLSSSTLGANNNWLNACNVAIYKSATGSGIVGQPFNYQLTVQNSNAVTINNVIVTDTQPLGLIFNSVSGSGCNLESGVVRCTLGTLPPNSSRLISVTATATTNGAITNTAQTNAPYDTLVWIIRRATQPSSKASAQLATLSISIATTTASGS